MADAFTRADLRAAGWTGRAITAGVRNGRLVRVRRGHYTTAATGREVALAVHIGGRLACISELRDRGVWVRSPSALHIQVARNASRLRRPDPSTTAPGDECVLHWRALVDPASATGSHVGILDALALAVRSLPRADAVAAIDSALNLRLISLPQLALAPPALAALLADVDPAAQSGLETLVRLVARDLGFRVRSQVRFRGIGIVDLLVEDWIVVETDGSEFHDDAIVSARDRRRDALHAAAGRTPLRFRYAQVVHEMPSVAAAIIGAVASHRRVHNSGRIVARALRRAAGLGLS
jgi:very-short-patch-repair endonuclease